MLLKRRTTSPLDIVQKLTLTRRRVVRVVLLIGDTQVCVLPYVLQRSLIANFQTYCTSSMHAIALAPIMEFNDHASLATPQQLQHTITPLHPSLDPYPSGRVEIWGREREKRRERRLIIVFFLAPLSLLLRFFPFSPFALASFAFSLLSFPPRLTTYFPTSLLSATKLHPTFPSLKLLLSSREALGFTLLTRPPPLRSFGRFSASFEVFPIKKAR